MPRLLTLLVLLGLCSPVVAADPPATPKADPKAEAKAAEEAAAAKRRAEIPLGGDLKPDPKLPAFVAVGHGARILTSLDDGQTWRQTFFAAPGSDHGAWATKAVAYHAGVFVVPVGWGGPTIYLASDDAVHWRHLTHGAAKMAESRGDPLVMPMTWNMVGGKGAFVASGYMTMTTTSDLGKTFQTFGLWSFKNDPRERKLVTHHVGAVYCGDKSGRFLALGNDRAAEGAMFGNLFASDDLGKTWRWLEPELLNAKCQGYSGMVSNGDVVLIADKDGAQVFRSTDAGQTWEGPFETGVKRVGLALVQGEFWLLGATSRASADGKTWRDLPKNLPAGKIAASDKGTLISVDGKRFNILRSADRGQTWQEVHKFEPETDGVHGAQGLRAVEFGLVRQSEP